MRNRPRLALLLLGPLLVLPGRPASATITTGSVTGGTAFTAGGAFFKLTPLFANPFGPANSVGNDTFQSPNLYGFDEDQNVVVTGSPLQVDVGAGPIAVGTTVASHYIFFDPGPSQSIVGTVNFDSDVLAIITSRSFLIASDYLANTGINYLSPGARGLEAGDSVTISGPRRILFDTSAASPGDYVRVLTRFSPSAAPEPATIFSVVLGAAGIVALRQRRKTRQS